MLSIARALIRRRWIVIGLWAIFGAYATMQAPRTPELLNVRGGTNRPTESSRANDLINTRFGAPLGEYFAVAVEAPVRVDSGPGSVVLDSLVAALQHLPGVREVVTWQEAADRPFLSADHKTTALIVALEATSGDSSSAMVQPVRQTIAKALKQFPGTDQYRVNVTGRSPLDLDARTLTSRETRRGELQLMPLTLVILVLAFGALVAAILPLMIGFLTISVSLTIVGLLTAVTPMSVFVLTIATMIGLGVGIDYSLLIVTRFREEMSRGFNRRDAAVNTILTAGGAVLWSGLTVVVGFGASRVERFLTTRPVPGIAVETLYNPFFETSDNLATCWLARHEMDEPFVLLNGDTLFEDRVLLRVLDGPPAPIAVTNAPGGQAGVLLEPHCKRRSRRRGVVRQGDFFREQRRIVEGGVAKGDIGDEVAGAHELLEDRCRQTVVGQIVHADRSLRGWRGCEHAQQREKKDRTHVAICSTVSRLDRQDS